MTKAPADAVSIPRMGLAVVLSAAAVTVGVSVVAAVVLGVFAALAGEATSPALGSVLMFLGIVGAAGASAWLLTGRVVPVVAAPTYVRASPRQARNLVVIASLLAGLVCAALLAGEGILASTAWLVAVTAAGAVGAWGAAARM